MPANLLIHETSPYLLQHAHNPVAWRPWGMEAIEAARRADKLIFLSIGYSTCYWCHVMERESFEDEATARVMNEGFICIKVDREERPDVDDLYMTAVQVMTGHGGWPMSMWLDPLTLAPVYGGTYFPPEPRHGMPSFLQALEAIARAWREDRENLREHGTRIAEIVREHAAAGAGAVAIGLDDVQRAISRLIETFNPEHGGFGGAPKFPQPAYLELLLEARGHLEGCSLAKVDTVVRTTLDHMAMGGMYDQIGGGFHRYSTDEKWLVPHFEKMLYDNAQLASLYVRAGEVYGDSLYERIARETLDYVLREMRDKEGGFFSAQDAEVNAREGLNYLWTAKEIEDVLREAGREESNIHFALRIWGLDRGPNFRDPHHPGESPRNVLHLVERPDALAQRFQLTNDDFWKRVEAVRAPLLAARMQREQPGTDDKVLTAWNGLMIAALAQGGKTLGDRQFIEAAERAAEFILSRMHDADRRLLRSFRAGVAKISGFFEDYALCAHGLLALASATGADRWNQEADRLMKRAGEIFGEECEGRLIFYDTATDQPDLFVRGRTLHDGAVPCGTSIMAMNLLTLHRLTGSDVHLDGVMAVLKGVSEHIQRNPLGLALGTTALLRLAQASPDRFDALSRGAGASERQGPVRVAADKVVVRIGVDSPGRLTLSIDIEAGYHINAHEPGDPSLAGLLVHIEGGEGIIVTMSDPPAEQWNGVHVHRGSIQIPLVVERIGPVTGEPRIAIRWQACSDRECLAPVEVVLPVRLVVEGK